MWLAKTVAHSSGKEGLLAWSGIVPTEVSINLTLGKRSPAHQHLKPGQWGTVARASLQDIRIALNGHYCFYPFGFTLCSFTCLKGVEYEW